MVLVLKLIPGNSIEPWAQLLPLPVAKTLKVSCLCSAVYGEIQEAAKYSQRDFLFFPVCPVLCGLLFLPSMP